MLFLDLRHVLEIRAVRTMQEQDADAHAFTGSHPDTMLASVKASRQVPGVRVSDFPLYGDGLPARPSHGWLWRVSPIYGPALPIGRRVRCRVVVRPPTSTGNCVCRCIAPCACVTSCCVVSVLMVSVSVVSVLVVSVLSDIRASSYLAAHAGAHPAVVRHRFSWPAMESHHDTRQREYRSNQLWNPRVGR